ncbi:olfactory receptor 2T2-like [Tachyglossus aculeatus]|uniref:olfactory receptor 2T2-like n=1 Tax=Tachyglossus aculeatus TaxID=9261 RepID=UPI0018F7A8D5|nr:olfactory receptor 2T2-like [Tachyglossus aculeatus]
MKKWNESSRTEFFLVGLFAHLPHPGLLVSTLSIVYLLALAGNSLMILLIRMDSRLHTPMYLFLSQLSLMDLLLTSVVVPKVLIDYLLNTNTITPVGCGVQMFLVMALGGGEGLLLGFMSYDRHIAICHPLRYPLLMPRDKCRRMGIGACVGAAAVSLFNTVLTMCLPYCGPRKVHHFLCEMPALLKLACVDVSIYEPAVFVICSIVSLIPFLLILASYAHILLTVLQKPSTGGWRKHSPEEDNILAVFYTVFTPMLNPLIYSLRNKEVTGALKKLFQEFWA